MRGVERLAPSDVAVLWPEDFGWPQDLGLLAILDGASRLDVEQLRAHVGSRVGLLPPRFRKVLVRPRRGLGRPYWVDAPDLDLEYHVRVLVLPAGVGERDLLEACEVVRRGRFDARRALWHLTLVEGLSGGRVALFMDVHHCLVDGVSGVTALGAFVDVDAPLDVPEPPSPRPAPTTLDLLVDVAVGAFRGLRSFIAAMLRARTTWTRLSKDVSAWRRTSRIGRTAATSVNTPLGPRRRYALVRTSLDDAKAVAHAHEATVNDVLLCALAGGLRALLASRGENPAGMTLRAAVPVSQHADAGGAEGNHDGGLLLALPVGEADPAIRLRQIARDSAERKRDAVLPGAASPFFQSGVVQRLVLRLTPRQRMSNSYVANVPGPPVALSLAGAPILEAFPIVPLVGNITVGLGALSYDGQLGLTVVADADACSDLDVLVAAVERDLVTLVQTLPVTAAR